MRINILESHLANFLGIHTGYTGSHRGAHLADFLGISQLAAELLMWLIFAIFYGWGLLAEYYNGGLHRNGKLKLGWISCYVIVVGFLLFAILDHARII